MHKLMQLLSLSLSHIGSVMMNWAAYRSIISRWTGYPASCIKSDKTVEICYHQPKLCLSKVDNVNVLFISSKNLWLNMWFYASCSFETRPIRPTMRPHDDEMIVWWRDYMRHLYLQSKSSIFPFSTKAWPTDGRTDRRTDGRTDPHKEMRGRI